MNRIPTFLYEKLINEYPFDLDKIIKGYSMEKPLTFRVNTIKTNREKIKEIINDYETVPWYKDAFIVKNNEDITKLDIYNNGEIYLQSLSSMIPPLILEPKEGESILDMAAAPGGKTTEISNLASGKALIMACEKNKIRASRLKYNIEKQGTKKVTVINKDARELDELFTFDKILLDAPCSGSGTINLNKEININEDLIKKSIKTQKELIKKALNHLKEGGELVYSTCSILKEENEDIINEVLSDNIKLVPIDKLPFLQIPLLPETIPGTLCICPSELYEGFFIAKLRKEEKHD